MANRLETHILYDGERWSIYSERAADIRRFEAWFGPPTRRGRGGACAYWDGLPADVVRIRRKARSRCGNPANKGIQKINALRASRNTSPPAPAAATGGNAGGAPEDVVTDLPASAAPRSSPPGPRGGRRSSQAEGR